MERTCFHRLCILYCMLKEIRKFVKPKSLHVYIVHARIMLGAWSMNYGLWTVDYGYYYYVNEIIFEFWTCREPGEKFPAQSLHPIHSQLLHSNVGAENWKLRRVGVFLLSFPTPGQTLSTFDVKCTYVHVYYVLPFWSLL